MNSVLTALHELSAVDLRYGLGTYNMLGRIPFAYIQIVYPDWDRQQLAALKPAIESGIVLNVRARPDGRVDVHVATRSEMAVSYARDGHTHQLQAPLWDAQLEAVDTGFVQNFDDARQRRGKYLLVLQAAMHQLGTMVDARGNTTGIQIQELGSGE